MEQDDVIQKELDLVGGLKNAISRGESIELAKQSLLNAGYSPQIVNHAVQRIMGQSTNTVTEHQVPSHSTVDIPMSNIVLPANNLQLRAKTSQGPLTQAPQRVFAQQGNQQAHMMQPGTVQPQQKLFLHLIPYWAVVLMILISLGIVIGAAIIGLYWQNLFS